MWGSWGVLVVQTVQTSLRVALRRPIPLTDVILERISMLGGWGVLAKTLPLVVGKYFVLRWFCFKNGLLQVV